MHGIHTDMDSSKTIPQLLRRAGGATHLLRAFGISDLLRFHRSSSQLAPYAACQGAREEGAGPALRTESLLRFQDSLLCTALNLREVQAADPSLHAHTEELPCKSRCSGACILGGLREGKGPSFVNGIACKCKVAGSERDDAERHALSWRSGSVPGSSAVVRQRLHVKRTRTPKALPMPCNTNLPRGWSGWRGKLGGRLKSRIKLSVSVSDFLFFSSNVAVRQISSTPTPNYRQSYRISLFLVMEEEKAVPFEGIVIKVRKASRSLAFLSLLASPITEIVAVAAAGPGGEGEHSAGDFVQVVLAHEEGWRRICSGGERLCCGAAVCGTGILEAANEDEGKATRISMPSIVVRDMCVKASPHDTASSAGAIRQHVEVEKRAAWSKRTRSGQGGENGGGGEKIGEQQRPGVGCADGPLCRQWWRGRCGESGGGGGGRGIGAGAGAGSGAGAGGGGGAGGESWGKHNSSQREWGKCGRRHFFADEAEWQRYEALAEERERMRERERDADDPHDASTKVSIIISHRMSLNCLRPCTSAGWSLPYHR